MVFMTCQPVLQFFAWFAALQANMDQDESSKYRYALAVWLFAGGKAKGDLLFIRNKLL